MSRALPIHLASLSDLFARSNQILLKPYSLHLSHNDNCLTKKNTPKVYFFSPMQHLGMLKAWLSVNYFVELEGVCMRVSLAAFKPDAKPLHCGGDTHDYSALSHQYCYTMPVGLIAHSLSWSMYYLQPHLKPSAPRMLRWYSAKGLILASLKSQACNCWLLRCFHQGRTPLHAQMP